MAKKSEPASSKGDEVVRLARKLLAKLESRTGPGRLVVGIAGVPGSGKTTLARNVCECINELFGETRPGSPPIAVDLPMDGFHYTRAHLASMPDPTTATHRRGAAFTFDAEGFLRLVKGLTAVPRQTVAAPSFDHATKDPIEGAITIAAETEIVLVEGNYCALDRDPWRESASLMTELWYIDIDSAIAHKRLAARHLLSGIVSNEKEAWERATGTDQLNAQDIRENRLPCDEILVLG